MNVRAVIVLTSVILAGCAAVSAADRPGYATKMEDGRLWVFAEGSKAHNDFKAKGEPAQQVTRIGAGPGGVTLKGPDTETLDGYVMSKPGFVTIVRGGRLWVFRQGSKEVAEFLAKGEPAQQVTRIGAGPRGVTIRSSDSATIDAYIAARS